MRRARGFTLVELLMVIAIIGILAAMVVVSISGAQTRARDTAVKSRLNTISSALYKFEIDNRRFPIRAEDSTANLGGVLVTPANFNAELVATGYLSAAQLDFGPATRARYISSLDGRRFAMAGELATATEGLTTTGNGVYLINQNPAVTGDNSVTIAPHRGSGLQFTNNQSINFQPRFGEIGGRTITISIWMRNPVLPPNNGNVRTLVATGHAGNDRSGYRLYIANNHGNPAIRFEIGRGGSISAWSQSLPISFVAEQWNHIAMVRNGPNLTFFHNGVVRSSTNESTFDFDIFISTNPSGLQIGNWTPMNDPAARYIGGLDGVQIYNRALEAWEISSLFNNGNGVFNNRHKLGLVAGFRFDEGTGDRVHSFGTGATQGTIIRHLLTYPPHSWIEGVTPFGLADICAVHPCRNGASSRAFVVYGPQ